jgi:hypothetical protein
MEAGFDGLNDPFGLAEPDESGSDGTLPNDPKQRSNT